MQFTLPHWQPGITSALGAAMLFGASTPLAKWLLLDSNPWILAGLLYLGSGLGLMLYRWARRMPKVKLLAQERGWFIGAIVAGGIIAPVLLMWGLMHMPASGASLLLNAEGVFTALLAWFAFKENVDKRIALGMAAIVAGALILSWPKSAQFNGLLPALAIVGACLAWGLDNNLTRYVSLTDATWIAARKGLVAGLVNLSLALVSGAHLPTWPIVGAALGLGFLAYGVSLSLFVVSLRYLGTARTGAYFSIAPFFGALLAIVLLKEPLTLALSAAGLFMALGLWLHLTEQHSHSHQHAALEHEHEHTHDNHHQHPHDFLVKSGEKHSHRHKHAPLIHTHAHFPDMHHQHLH